MLRSAVHGAFAGGVALVSMFLLPWLLLSGARFGPLAEIAGVMGFAFVFGAIHGAVIGLVAGFGWRLVALLVGPLAFAWVPLSVVLGLRAGVGGALGTILYLAAGGLTSGWVYYATRPSAAPGGVSEPPQVR